MIRVSWHCVSKQEPWLLLLTYAQHPDKSAWLHNAPSDVATTKPMFFLWLVILSPYCWMFEPRRAICGENHRMWYNSVESVVLKSTYRRPRRKAFHWHLASAHYMAKPPQCLLQLPSNTSPTNIQMTDIMTPIVGLQGVLQRTTTRDYWTRVGVRSYHVHRGPNKLKSSVHTVRVILYVWITNPLMESSLCTI